MADHIYWWYLQGVKKWYKIVEIEDITGFQKYWRAGSKPKSYIHGGILYKRDSQDHVNTIDDMNIGPIDMVVTTYIPLKIL